MVSEVETAAPTYTPTAEEIAAAENKNIMSLTTVVPLALYEMVGEEVGVDADGKPKPTGAWLRQLIADHFGFQLPAEAARGRAKLSDDEKRARAQEANAKRQAIIAELKRRKGQ